MSAFCAAHELRGRFVAPARLHLPDVNRHVSAFFAFHADCGHGFDFLFFLAYDGHERLSLRLKNLDNFCLVPVVCRWFNVAAFCAGKHYRVFAFFGFKPATAFWTKFHKLTLPHSIFLHTKADDAI